MYRINRGLHQPIVKKKWKKEWFLVLLFDVLKLHDLDPAQQCVVMSRDDALIENSQGFVGPGGSFLLASCCFLFLSLQYIFAHLQFHLVSTCCKTYPVPSLLVHRFQYIPHILALRPNHEHLVLSCLISLCGAKDDPPGWSYRCSVCMRISLVNGWHLCGVLNHPKLQIPYNPLLIEKKSNKPNITLISEHRLSLERKSPRTLFLPCLKSFGKCNLLASYEGDLLESNNYL